MTLRTVPFHSELFYHAMIDLVGREPDSQHNFGWDGLYTFRYEPRDDLEERKFREVTFILQEWLSLFELVPFKSRCEYGRLPRPEKGQEKKDYLDIKIVHFVEKKEGR